MPKTPGPEDPDAVVTTHCEKILPHGLVLAAPLTT